MSLKEILGNLSTPKFYVAEIVRGKQRKITSEFAFKADAEEAIRRMPKGKYVVVAA